MEELYNRYNTRGYARHDPVSFAYDYEDRLDAEVVGFVAAMLAYGSLGQIMASVSDALERLGGEPYAFLTEAEVGELADAARGFTHRFVDGRQFGYLLERLKGVLCAHGSLEACFSVHDRPVERTILPGLRGLAAELRGPGDRLSHLVADPHRGSACKRWHLFLRWMVRRDEVDPGIWQGVDPARLVVPLDTHMWRVCQGLGLTDRKTVGLKAALEVTEGFREVSPADPVKYDFALMHASVEADPALQRMLTGGASA